jgi:hypothetical protein
MAPLLDACLLPHFAVGGQRQQRLDFARHSALFSHDVPATNQRVLRGRYDANGFA